MKTIKSALIALLLLAAAPPTFADPRYTFSDLGAILDGMGHFGGPSINNSGQVVGPNFNGINDLGQKIGWNPVSGNPAVLNGSAFTDLGVPTGGSGYANAINNAGTVVGWTTAPGSEGQATLWSGAGYSTLSTAGAYSSMAYDINDSGQVAGASFFLVANSSGFASRPVATIWNGASATLIPTVAGSSSFALTINNSGVVAGQLSSGGADSGFVWDGSTMTVLGKLGGMNSTVRAINSAGDIVGFSATSGDYNDIHAVLWQQNTTIDLNSFLSQATRDAGWVLVDASDINDKGMIVGRANNVLTGQLNHAFMLAPVPEPETYAMFLAGLGLMGAMARRRQRAYAP